MNAVIKGAKAGQGKPRQPVIAPDSAQSITRAKIQYGLSEGEVEGLANGLQSVYLDNTPLQNPAGGWNFERVQADFRYGTNDQPHIEGFPDISSESAVGVELKSESPWVRAISNTDLDAVSIRFRWGPLRQQNAENGDVKGYTIQYAIDLQTDGGTWTEVLNTQIAAKTSNDYKRQHTIQLPQADIGWTIRVRRLTPNSTSEYISDKMYVDAITEVIDLKLSYPNTAMLGLQYDAETFSNVAKIAVDLKGIKVQVPTNYDPVARTYAGMWDGTFKRAYTNNPAWIYYDICTAKRYALGDRLTSAMLDKWSLYRLAQYCDQMVDDGKGGLEPRFTCNVYLQSTEDAYAILSKLAGVFRAISYWDGNSIVCDADIPQDTYFTYTRANVIDGLFEYTGTRARDRHTVAKVAWDNPANHYKTEYVYVRDEAAIAKLGVRIAEIDAWGCTSEGQAQRAGLWALKSEQLETRTVSFKVGLDGYIPQPGRVIEIADELFAGRANGGRISAVSADRKIITLDRDDVVCRAGDRLVVNGENGKAQARIVSSVSGRNITVTTAFDSIAPENVWAVDAQDLKTMKFRVMSITQDDKHQFSITALQYESAKYDAIDFGAFIDERPISIINPTVQAPVESVSITSETMVQQGLSVETMVISWPQAQGATKYQVEWRKDDGTWIKLPITGNNSVEVSGIYAGNYEARVTAISAFDIASLPTYSMLTTLSGKQGLPPALANISATGILFGYRLNWNFPAVGALDTAYTEIEISSTSNGANAAQLGLFAYPTDTHVIQGMQPNLTRWFRGRLIDRIGNIGPWSARVSATTSADASAVLDILSGKITESQLHQNLQTKIDKIDTIAGLDGDIGNLIDNISAVQIQADQISDELGLERQQRVAAIQDLDDGLTQEVLDRKNGETAIYGYVNTYKLSNDKALASFQDSLNVALTDSSLAIEKTQALDGRVQVAEDEAGNALFNSASALQKANIAIDDTKALSSLVTEVKAVAEQSADTADTAAAGAASALEKATASATKSDANANKIEEITAELGTKASTGALNQTNANIAEVAGKVNANTTRLNGVYAQVNPDMIGSTEGLIGSTAGHVGTWTLQSAVIEGDMALSQRIDTTVAEIDNAKALVQTEAYARAQEDEALSSRINTLKVDVDGNKAAIKTLEIARATDNEAFAGRFYTLQASTATKGELSEVVATIQQEQGVFANDLDAISGEIKTIQGYVDGQQTGIEVVSAVGDLNKLKNEIAKARLDEDITKLQGQSAALTSAVNSYDARIAEITSKRTAEQAKEDKNQELIDLYTSQIAELNAAKVDANAQKSAISSQVAQITADKARLNSLVITESKIKAQYTIKLDYGGVISSYGLAVEESGGTNYHNFVIRADSFALAGPASEGSTPYYPFIFRNTPFTDPVTGTVFPVGAYIKSAFMDYQSVKTSHIEDLAVKTAKIDDLAVTRGKIADLAVNTLKIQDNAVTVPIATYNDTPNTWPSSMTDRYPSTYAGGTATLDDTSNAFGDLISITLNRSGGKCRIEGNVEFKNLQAVVWSNNQTVLANSNQTLYVGLILLKNGSIIRRMRVPANTVLLGDGIAQFNGFVNMPIHLDDAGTGNTTYTLRIGIGTTRGSPAGVYMSRPSNLPEYWPSVVSASLAVMEIKK